MYELQIWDVCDLSDPNKNGSLEHVSVDFCLEYSFTKNGPCQNNGTLIPSSNLAKDDARCKCKENYTGEFCDMYNGKIKCQDTNPGVHSPQSCDVKGFNGRYCLLKVNGVSFWCDSESPVSGICAIDAAVVSYMVHKILNELQCMEIRTAPVY
ncbi:uncharacterized protein LOC133185018 [Saccostrea echinata]|uniref:uncharacterized protein LOC133185018 n=1 Tax=Saccostrea echinata TaxID=191078 RepID=UPI002A8199F5|nr:uncharacterized protein LOC133185018 [Saccostrea echinata]